MDVNQFKDKIRLLLIRLNLYKVKEHKIIFTCEIHKFCKFDIGEYTYGEPNVLFPNSDAKLTIGKFCSIASDVTIFLGGNHRIDWITTYPFNAIFNEYPIASKIIGHPATNGDVIVGNDVWIGYGSTIMSGVSIGHGAVIAAKSVVTKDIGAYEIWGGNPAKFIRKRFADDKIKYLIEIKWWDWDIETIKENISQLCSTRELINNNKN